MALLEKTGRVNAGQPWTTGLSEPVAQPESISPRRRVRSRRSPIVLALMAVALVKQLVLVVAYPPFQGHDEVAHLGYLGTLANDGRLPTFSDTLPAALETYSQFTLDWPALYTANHPPLYYVTSLPAYWLAGDSYEAQLYAVRLMAVPLFLLTIWLTYLIARLLFPSNDLVAIGAPAGVAFQPQIGFEGAITTCTD